MPFLILLHRIYSLDIKLYDPDQNLTNSEALGEQELSVLTKTYCSAIVGR
jgi:hypothetical protein